MKIICFIEARFRSTRLPGKVLQPILGKPMLELMVERLK
ncbi:MAG: acylneuraminate cytidylyltransferase, partial [Acidobacteriota bacterium]|nr:acylneuraminate cytidylyltransferase [Acidobacteriota bacterium]